MPTRDAGCPPYASRLGRWWSAPPTLGRSDRDGRRWRHPRIGFPATTFLAAKFGVPDYSDSSGLYRLVSAFAHAKQWALARMSLEQGGPAAQAGTDSWAGNDRIAVGASVVVTDHVVKALSDAREAPHGSSATSTVRPDRGNMTRSHATHHGRCRRLAITSVPSFWFQRNNRRRRRAIPRACACPIRWRSCLRKGLHSREGSPVPGV